MAKRSNVCTPYNGPERRDLGAERKLELELVARTAAKLAVVDTFTTIGLDISSPAAIAAAQKDLLFVRSLRKSLVYLVCACAMAVLGFKG